MSARRQWKPYLVRWSIVLVCAMINFVVIFTLSKRGMPRLLAWLKGWALFPGANDVIDWLGDLGPVSLALGASAVTVRVGALWARRAAQEQDSSSGLPSAMASLVRAFREGRSLMRPGLVWTTAVVAFVVIPIWTIVRLLQNPGRISLDTVQCFVLGGVVMAALATRAGPSIERLMATTIGTIWRWGSVDLRGRWQSTYQYVSDGEARTAVQIMQITQIGRVARGRNIGGSSPHRHSIRMTINGDYVTGEWRNIVRGARHHGVFQLRIKANGRQMVGRWVGFDSEANIQDGLWTWERL